MISLLLLVACGGLRGTPNTDAANSGNDTGIDVVVEHRGGSSGNSSGSSDDTNTGDTANVQDTITCYWDDDLDGKGDLNEDYLFAGDTCPEGYVENGDDWCDNDAGAYTATDCATRAADADADGVTVGAGDCDDTVATTFPGATETCNGIDDDCNGLVDDYAFEADGTIAYLDADGDGYGDGTDGGELACAGSHSATYTADNADDCDDTNAATNPGATEVEADGIDNNCDGTMAGESSEITCCFEGDLSDCMMTYDAACPSDYVQVTYGMTCCVDGDNDGFGDADTCLVTAASECPEGDVEGDGDCDDSHYGTSPAEDDPYGDGRDTDCDSYDG